MHRAIDWLITTGFDILIIGLFTLLITLVFGNILWDISNYING